jgi:hypothetical protein
LNLRRELSGQSGAYQEIATGIDDPALFLSVIASEAKQSMDPHQESWIASSLCSSQ